MPGIIDAHHHIWLKQRTPWLNGPMEPRIFGEYDRIRRDYAIQEYAEEAKAAGISKSVYIQINVASGDEIWEMEWAAEEGKKQSLVQATVSFADLTSPDVGSVLDRQIAISPLRGVRQQMHWHEIPLYSFASRADLMMDRGFRNGMKQVEKRGLLFELQVFQSQFPNTLDLVDAFPNVQFVLVHSGMPHSQEKEAFNEWQMGLRKFAERPNVVTKISGAGTFQRRCDVAEWREVIVPAVEIFGPDRSLFGSNFPIEKLWTDYSTLVETVKTCIEGFSSQERQSVMHDTAARVYNI